VVSELFFQEDNMKIPEKLAGAIKENNLVLFAGEGLSLRSSQ
jgi:hypothetical protein